MSNKTENDLTKGYSGIFGNQVVLKNRRGKSVMTIPATKPRKLPNENQLRVRTRFTLASHYAVNILLDPLMKEVYTAKARKGRSAYLVAMTDYLRLPQVIDIDTADYEGKPGDRIHVVAYDDFAVTGVTVHILDNKGVVIEKGDCVQDPVTGYYDYAATVLVDDLTGAEIIAMASDYPGHTGKLSVTL
jgi:hypothetical protein